MGGFTRDLRYAIRSLIRQPMFAAIAVGTIAIGIGANTAIFSVVQAVLLRPLPYENPDRLVVIWANLTNRNQPKFPISPPDLRDFREQATQYEGLGGVVTFTQTLTGGDGDPEVIDVAGVTANLHDVLGVRPWLGRGFEPADEEPIAPNTDASAIPPASVILSNELWQRRFGGDDQIIGQTVEVNNNAAVIVGVMRPGVGLHFGTGNLTQQVDMWTTPRIDVAAWQARRNVSWAVVGRMKPGVSIAQAQAEMDGFTARFREESSLRETAGWQVDVHGMLGELTAEIRPVILALFGAVAFVLLIACANVSNLFLVRASSREREFAIRTALGGSRIHVIRQLLIESGVLALAGGGLGLLLALGGNRILLAMRPANLPRMETVSVDLSVLGFTAVASIAAALLFGLFPAIQVSKPHLTDSLKDRGRSSSLSRQRVFRSGIIITEVALCLVLMIGAGLMMRSFMALQRVEPGYDAENVLTFNIALPGNRYPDPEKRIFFESLDQQLLALPGVTNVAAASTVPLQNNFFTGRYGPLEAATDESLYGQAAYRAIRPGYFETLRTDLLDGRLFSPADFADSTPVVVVDEVLASLIAPNESAIGKRLLIRITTLEPVEVEVIGVVEHQRGPSLARDGTEGIYVTNLYAGTFGNLAYAVRTTSDPLSLVRQVRRELDALDPILPLSDVRSMEARVSEAMTETRFALALIGAFGFMALALASIGIYGVLSHTVRQRVGEIGVLETAGGALLLVPRTAAYGAGVLLPVMVGAFITRLGDGRPADLVAILVYRTLLLWFAYEWRDRRRPHHGHAHAAPTPP